MFYFIMFNGNLVLSRKEVESKIYSNIKQTNLTDSVEDNDKCAADTSNFWYTSTIF